MSSPRRLTPHKRLVLALRDTPVIWSDTLPNPELSLSLLSQLPTSPPFTARIAPHTESSPAIVTYKALLQLGHNTLLIRVPPPSPPTLGILPLRRPTLLRRGVLALPGVLLTAPPATFSAIASALTRATLPPTPALSRFTILRTLASGTRSKVFLVRDTTTGESLALKLLPRPRDDADIVHWTRRVISDRALLTRARGHPFLPDLRHAIVTSDAAALLLEHCTGGDLFNLVRGRGKPLAIAEAAAVVAQVLSAVQRLYAMGACANNGPGTGLRPENVLVDGCGWVRLASFGPAPVLDTRLVRDAVTFRSRGLERGESPQRGGILSEGEEKACVQSAGDSSREVAGEADVGSSASLKSSTENAVKVKDGDVAISADGQDHDTDTGALFGEGEKPMQDEEKEPAHPSLSDVSIDMWGLGVLSYFLLTGNFPFETEQIASHEPASGDDDSSINFSTHVLGESSEIEDTDARDFVAQLLKRDVSSRLGCGSLGLAEVRKHPWLAHINWYELERREGPAALKIGKQKAVELLDLSEQDIRQTFSVPVLPEGLSRRDSKRGKLNRLFFRDSKGSNEIGSCSSTHTDTLTHPSSKKEADAAGKGARGERLAGENVDACLAYGFGFSSVSPGFSVSESLKKGITTARAGSLPEGDRRQNRRSGSRKARASTGSRAAPVT